MYQERTKIICYAIVWWHFFNNQFYNILLFLPVHFFSGAETSRHVQLPDSGHPDRAVAHLLPTRSSLHTHLPPRPALHLPLVPGQRQRSYAAAATAWPQRRSAGRQRRRGQRRWRWPERLAALLGRGVWPRVLQRRWPTAAGNAAAACTAERNNRVERYFPETTKYVNETMYIYTYIDYKKKSYVQLFESDQKHKLISTKRRKTRQRAGEKLSFFYIIYIHKVNKKSVIFSIKYFSS